MHDERLDGRLPEQIRPLTFQRHWLPAVAGSVLVKSGNTHVLCTAVIEDGVPKFLQQSGEGWLTAEYSMLPAATGARRQRERTRVDGRSTEIQRLIGRCLRAVVDRRALKHKTIWVDCDVLAADGGTRTASINGAYVAVHDALTELKERGDLRKWPLRDSVQAISVGLVEGKVLADLSYYEDSSAEVDMNVVMTGSGKLIEVNGGAEQGTFAISQHHEMLKLAQTACGQVSTSQKSALGS